MTHEKTNKSTAKVVTLKELMERKMHQPEKKAERCEFYVKSLGGNVVLEEPDRSRVLEVLDSERSLFRSELNESDSLRRQLVALVELYKALGGGWEMEPQQQQATGTAATTPQP